MTPRDQRSQLQEAMLLAKELQHRLHLHRLSFDVEKKECKYGK